MAESRCSFLPLYSASTTINQTSEYFSFLKEFGTLKIFWYWYKIGEKRGGSTRLSADDKVKANLFFCLCVCVSVCVRLILRIDRFVECKIKSIFGNRIERLTHEFAKYVSLWNCITWEHIRWSELFTVPFLSLSGCALYHTRCHSNVHSLARSLALCLYLRAKDGSKYGHGIRAVSLLNLL